LVFKWFYTDLVNVAGEAEKKSLKYNENWKHPKDRPASAGRFGIFCAELGMIPGQSPKWRIS
jgi:hypothetical protein